MRSVYPLFALAAFLLPVSIPLIAQEAELAWMRGGHPESVTGVVFTADSRMLVSAGQEGTLRVWDLERALMLGRFTYGDAGSFRSLSISPDGSTVLVSTSFGALLQIGTSDWRLLRWFDVGERVNAATWSPDGTTIAAALSTGNVALLDAQSGRIRRVIAAHIGDVNALDFSPDGSLLATAGSDYATRVWNVGSGELRWAVSEIQYPGYAVQFSPDGTVVASLGFHPEADFKNRYRGVVLYDALTGDRREVHHPFFYERVLAIRFSPDGRYLAAAAEDFDKPAMRVGPTISVADRRGQRGWSHAQKPRDGMATSLAWSPDGRYVAWGNYTGSIRWAEHELDTTVPRVAPMFNRLTGHIGRARTLTLSPGDSVLVSGGADGEVILAHAAAGGVKARTVAHTMEARFSTYTPDGTRIATAGEDGTVKVWSSETLEPYRTLYISAGAPVSAAVYDAAGNIFASLGTWDSAAVLVDSLEAGVLKTFRGSPGGFRKMTPSVNGASLVCGGHGGELRSFDVGTMATVAQTSDDGPDITAIAVSDDDLVFSGNGEGFLTMREGSTLETIWRGLAHRGGIGGLAVSADGRHLVSGGADSTLVLWRIELEALHEVVRIRSYEAGYLATAINSDASMVFGATEDGGVAAYRVRLSSAVHHGRDSDPFALRLGLPYPQPVQGRFELPVQLTEHSEIRLELHNILGACQRPPLETTLAAGSHTLAFDTGDLEPGLYLLRLTCQGWTATTPLVVTR